MSKTGKDGRGHENIFGGKTRVKSVYGIRTGEELGFVIITDIHGEGTRASAGSAWTA